MRALALDALGRAATAGVSAAFILVNSLAGLAGHGNPLAHLPPAFAWWAAAALVGATLGSRHLPGPALRRAFELVLVVAGAKMLAQ